jgi:DNA-binding PadR family transcriptional regulator
LQITDAIETPTATTYAILGLLAESPKSANELARQMSDELRWFWPRARSHVFTQVNKLARLGWIEAVANGPRRKIVYRVNAGGRAALRRWLSEEPGAVGLEIEHLVRVRLAQAGNAEALRRTLNDAQQQATAMLSALDEESQRMLTDPSLTGVQLLQRSIVVGYLVRFAQMNADWATHAAAELESSTALDDDDIRKLAARDLELRRAAPRVDALRAVLDAVASRSATPPRASSGQRRSARPAQSKRGSKPRQPPR